MSSRFIVSSLVAFSVACGGGSSGRISLPTGFALKIVAQETQTTTFFRRNGNSGAIESKGTVGAQGGPQTTCADALASAGTKKITKAGTRESSMEVIGQTPVSHPLIPNADTFGGYQAAVIKQVSTFKGQTTTNETFYAPGAATERYSTDNVHDDGLDTVASYWALVVDEYYLALTSLGNLWVEMSPNGAEPALEPTDLEHGQMLTRFEPQKGDMWSSVNGNTLYVFDGQEDMKIGSKTYKTNRIKLYAVNGMDPTAADVLDTCITQQANNSTSTLPGAMANNSFEAHVNAGCESKFVHAQVGTEWWYKGALVKYSRVKNEVKIGEYGYEWGIQPAAPPMAPCTRFANHARADDSGIVFVEYQVITTQEDGAATELKEQ